MPQLEFQSISFIFNSLFYHLSGEMDICLIDIVAPVIHPTKLLKSRRCHEEHLAGYLREVLSKTGMRYT